MFTSTSPHLPSRLGLVAALLACCGLACGQQCATFETIYGSGRALCENMWGGAFTYETNESAAYTMWFFDKTNPNDATSKALHNKTADQCHLQYLHKDAPGPEPDSFTECHPWKENACCHDSSVDTPDVINSNYGDEYRWDRCGPLSQACERFFVQEACFYECEPSAGLYRKFPAHSFDPNNDSHNERQMHGMPIKAGYCDAWFEACRHDLFCAEDDGDFFSCAKVFAQQDAAATGLSPGAIAGITVGAVLFAAAIVFIVVLIHRERDGKAVFTPLSVQA